MLAIIGGSGLTRLSTLAIAHREVVRTPYGEPSSALVFGQIASSDVVFIARHGHGHTIPPHRVNYRANLWALKERGATAILAVASVGGIRDGATLVGMTGMPEAALARELGLPYAAIAVVVNHAAGRGESSEHISMDGINKVLHAAMDKVRTLLEHIVPLCVEDRS